MQRSQIRRTMNKTILWMIFFILNLQFAPAKLLAEMTFSPRNFADIVESATPAVVFVAVEENAFENSYGSNPDIFSQYLMRPIYEYFWPSLYSHGSGFIISSDGYIVTNAHVVEGGTCIAVALQHPELRICYASVVGIDWDTDLAVLKIINPSDLPFPYLKLGNSDKIKVGEPVIAIGSPILSAFESTVTMGIISGKERNLCGVDPIEGYIQTDTRLNKGNSGGPLLDTDGNVIGIVNWGFSNLGLNFVIPSNTAERVINQILTKGIVKQGFLGVDLYADVEFIFDYYCFESMNGAEIVQVLKHSPAERAGLVRGDRIIKLNDSLINSSQSLRNYILTLAPGTKITLTVDRQGEIFEIPVSIGTSYMYPNFLSC